MNQDPQQNPNHYVEQQRRHGIGVKIGNFIRNRVHEMAVGDIHDGMSTHSVDLHGYSESQQQVTDPLTGETTDQNVIKFPRVPRTKHSHTPVYEHGFEANQEHTIFSDITKAIAHDNNAPSNEKSAHKTRTNSFHGAIRSHEALLTMMRTTADDRVTLPRRFADGLTREGAKRSDYIGEMYNKLNHEVYSTVMAVPNEEIQGDNRTWEEELNLYNIQVLRTRLIAPWQATSNSKVQGNALLEAGDLLALGQTKLSQYLGVDVHDLRAQLLDNGRKVVPIQVLNKINFFINYASNFQDEGELSPGLAMFDVDEDYDPDNSSSPIYRMNHEEQDLRELHKKLDPQINKARAASARSLEEYQLERSSSRDKHRPTKEAQKKEDITERLLNERILSLSDSEISLLLSIDQEVAAAVSGMSRSDAKDMRHKIYRDKLGDMTDDKCYEIFKMIRSLKDRQ